MYDGSPQCLWRESLNLLSNIHSLKADNRCIFTAKQCFARIVFQPKTQKAHFGRHGMLKQSYHTRSIRHRILTNIRGDDTLDFTFQCHFQGHKVKKWQQNDYFHI